MCAERLPGEQKNSFVGLASADSSWRPGPASLSVAHQDRAQRGGARFFVLPLRGSPGLCTGNICFCLAVPRRVWKSDIGEG